MHSTNSGDVSVFKTLSLLVIEKGATSCTALPWHPGYGQPGDEERVGSHMQKSWGKVRSCSGGAPPTAAVTWTSV